MPDKKLIYLASPYSHPDPAVREARYAAVCKAAAECLREGLHVFSPIAHSHVIAQVGGISGDWQTWRDLDMAVLARCDELMVVTLDGWEQSVGVKAEMEEARRLGLPVEFIQPEVQS